MSKSAIEWTTETWNPIVGCSVISPGCTHCYAMRMARRIELMGTAPHYAGLTQESKAGAVWTGKLAPAPDEILFAPLRKKKPTTWFVNSMSDLFHEAVPGAWIDRVFAVMALCPQHTFQVLTKRSKRMREYLAGDHPLVRLHNAAAADVTGDMARPFHPYGNIYSLYCSVPWPLPNVWLGVSTEDQDRADERIPDLLATPAAVRFISAEPLLSAIYLWRWVAIDWQCSSCRGYFTGKHRPFCPQCGAEGGWSGSHPFNGRHYPPGPIAPSQRGSGLDWVIVGGESGPGARGCYVPAVRDIVRVCGKASVPVFVKQLGAYVVDRNDAGFDGCAPYSWPDGFDDRVEHDINGYREDHQGADCRVRLHDRKGGTPEEWPEDLRVRQMPA